ncbi:uncharacterized protein LOC126742572 isoform X2 [Anthonomus grandis grandis]|uniref:uncharacterized protein LOC126742572 isoform X2 n=1 Tax=Anthonomus grandis grandis TaxID=2921223 RepID=UPI002166105C|nr:uncharacterized protein LOC126742572 isoform X2 [Anthonomus grandis grandis]
MARNIYENEQKRLQMLMNEALAENNSAQFQEEVLDMSDEDVPEPFGDYSEDDYLPSDFSSTDSEDYEPVRKKRKKQVERTDILKKK